MRILVFLSISCLLTSGCNGSSQVRLKPAVTISIHYHNTTNKTVYANLGKDEKGSTVKRVTLPGQRNVIPITIPEGKDKIEIPLEDERGENLGTLTVSR